MRQVHIGFLFYALDKCKVAGHNASIIHTH
jgi:hypothetical protein